MIKQNSLTGAFVMGNAGLFLIYILPQMLSMVTAQYQLTAVQSGLFGSSDLIGSALISVSSIYWIRKISLRRYGLIGLCIILIGNLLCTLVDDFSTLLLLRVFCGIGEGLVIALTLIMIHDSKNLEKNFAIYLMVTLVVGAIMVLLNPYLIGNFGSDFIFLSQGGMALLALPFCFTWIPDYALVESDVTFTSDGLNFKAIRGLFAIMLMFVGYGGLWAFSEQIGIARGFDQEFISLVLSGALGIALIGLALPIIFNDQKHAVLFITLGMLGLLGYALLISFGQNQTDYLVAIWLGSLAVNMVLPYMTGVIAEFDSTGKSMVLIMPLYSIGFALGPVLISLLLQGNGNTWLGLGMSLLFALVLWIFLELMKRLKQTTDE